MFSVHIDSLNFPTIPGFIFFAKKNLVLWLQNRVQQQKLVMWSYQLRWKTVCNIGPWSLRAGLLKMSICLVSAATLFASDDTVLVLTFRNFAILSTFWIRLSSFFHSLWVYSHRTDSSAMDQRKIWGKMKPLVAKWRLRQSRIRKAKTPVWKNG